MGDIKKDCFNVLIGSNGGLTGIYLAKQLRKNSRLVLFGADSDTSSGGKFFVDEQVFLPNATSDGYISALMAIIEEKAIDIYLPTHSKEIKVISENEKKIREMTNVRFMVSPMETFEALDDKETANNNLRNIGIPVPNIIMDMATDYPIFMKKKIGSGSSGSSVIENRYVHEAYYKTTHNTAFFELIKGREFTLDCMYDMHGKLIGFNQRERLKTIGGAVSITQNSYDFDIKPYIEKISAKWKFCGCVNFQYIVKDNVPYFIDVNLRYPSGGLPLTVESGLNVPQIVIELLTGGDITPEMYTIRDKKKRMYRYFEEIFE